MSNLQDMNLDMELCGLDDEVQKEMYTITCENYKREEKGEDLDGRTAENILNYKGFEDTEMPIYCGEHYSNPKSVDYYGSIMPKSSLSVQWNKKNEDERDDKDERVEEETNFLCKVKIFVNSARLVNVFAEGFEDGNDTEMPIYCGEHSADPNSVKYLAEFVNHYESTDPPTVPKPLLIKDLSKALSDQWAVDFIDKVYKERGIFGIYRLAETCNYVECQSLLDLCIAKITSLSRGESLSTIRMVLDSALGKVDEKATEEEKRKAEMDAKELDDFYKLERLIGDLEIFLTSKKNDFVKQKDVDILKQILDDCHDGKDVRPSKLRPLLEQITHPKIRGMILRDLHINFDLFYLYKS